MRNCLVATSLFAAVAPRTAAWPSAPPYSSRNKASMCLSGELFVYSTEKRLAAFRSGGGSSSTGGGSGSGSSAEGGQSARRHAVFVPGLSDGLLALDYVPALAEALDRLGYSFVQPVLSSSYKGYGTSSLHQDVEELDELLGLLSSPPSADSSSGVDSGSKGVSGSDSDVSFLLIGHSTGCQDAVFYMKHGRRDLRERVLGVVLQAPVSDREYLETLPETEGFVKEARAKAGGGELMPVETTDAPITAARFLSLATKDGDDDMFSGDLSPDERHSRLGHMASVPTAAFLSGADEYVPQGEGRPTPEALAETLRAAMVVAAASPSSPPGGACGAAPGSDTDAGAGARAREGEEPGKERDTPVGAGAVPPTITREAAAQKKTMAYVIPGANHALSDPSHAEEFVAKVEAFAAGLSKE